MALRGNEDSASEHPATGLRTDGLQRQPIPGGCNGWVQRGSSRGLLRLSVTMPVQATPDSSLPVLVFVHGGAFFIGSYARPYYDPITLCSTATEAGSPHIFVSINYRLGGAGFFHSPEAAAKMPANNGLHDQRIGFEWIQQFIGGFGGDPDNITAPGQSAGGMSVTTHNLSGKDNIWKRSISFSGSLVTMPVKSLEEHQQNFLSQAYGPPHRG